MNQKKLTKHLRPEFPSSDEFWTLSDAYRDAGLATFAKIQTTGYSGFAVIPCVFLFFRSIELSLKSVLVYYEVPETEIVGALGHRIADLIARVESHTLLETIGISLPDRKMLDRFSDGYSNKQFEYSGDWWTYPQLEDLRNLACRICDKVRFFPNRR